MQEIKVTCKGANTIEFTKLKAFQGNLKDLSKENYAKLKKEILELGFTEPVSVWKKNEVFFILNGHQRIRTLSKMKEEGFKIPKVPINIIEAKDKKEAKKKILALTSQYGEMTGQGLREFMEEAGLEFEEIKDSFRFPEIDFDNFQDEFFEGTGTQGLTDEDLVPEKVEPRTKIGDLYQLGNHRLLCGDSTDEKHVEKLMAGEKVDMVYSDPPYGIDEETDRAFASRTRKAKGNTFDKIIGDDSIDTAVRVYGRADIKAPIVVYWGGNYYAHVLPASPCWIVWDKRVEENQRDMNSDCELAYVKHPNKKSARIFRHLWKGMIKGSEQGQARVHPTQKPIALAEWCFDELAPTAINVLDFFGGSGSTLIACEKTQRKCYMMEIDPHYCDVIVQRWENFTGLKANLIESGKKEKR